MFRVIQLPDPSPSVQTGAQLGVYVSTIAVCYRRYEADRDGIAYRWNDLWVENTITLLSDANVINIILHGVGAM